MKIRTHRCGEFNKARSEKQVVLNGWVQRRRDHGMVLFIDLRDRTGMTQVVFNAERNAAVHKAAHTLAANVSCRSAGRSWPVRKNPKIRNLPTGEIEIFVDAVEILNEAKTPPFMIEDESRSPSRSV